MRTLLESIAIVGPSWPWRMPPCTGAPTKRPGLAERRREHGGERWTIQ